MRDGEFRRNSKVSLEVYEGIPVLRTSGLRP